jgi:hypothetical protein
VSSLLLQCLGRGFGFLTSLFSQLFCVFKGFAGLFEPVFGQARQFSRCLSMFFGLVCSGGQVGSIPLGREFILCGVTALHRFAPDSLFLAGSRRDHSNP